ncbi:hypothetical protein AJ80_02755 [Polytolypa hystricis UAMH7299]|uniref:ER membrane protein complex subunit 7 beta-sandwich domain-containing protein n=1 Tax=Polytolypa hystricis (strain UAMH7299) TaxID=1447883 RepID=A0A2B7YNB9_POLH7|nr:hypothetical protein AJ80_02755 [Polytolypa hystricis UAMH7299]
MHLPTSLLLLSSTALASLLTISIPSSAVLPNPNTLPPSTHATLTTLSASPDDTNPVKAHISRTSTFQFADLSQVRSQNTASSYLLDIHSRDYVFAPYRVDVGPDGKVVGVWETYRGNPWGNKGAEKFPATTANGADSVKIEARVLGKRGFYEERQKFSPLSLFKNPMILLAVFALAITFGMPYLMDNMDPEMREEFDKQSRTSPLAGATRSLGGAAGGAGGSAAAPGFDLAGWMAGTSPGPLEAARATVSSSTSASTSGRESGGATNRRR